MKILRGIQRFETLNTPQYFNKIVMFRISIIIMTVTTMNRNVLIINGIDKSMFL